MNALRFPQLFSTVMLQIVGELFHSLPEVGDVSKPRLVIVIDEAHLLFRDLSPRLLSELEMMMKLIRSKGVGILFCTQNPLDIPESILSQLGLKIQHALRVFTAKDQESIRKMAKNFPLTSYYDVATELTTLGTGEALITALGEDGRPTPLVAAKILPPESRMDTITTAELGAFLSISPIFPIYQHALNPESATEILVQKMQLRAEEQAKQEQIKAQQQAEKVRKNSPSLTDSIVQSATQSIGTELARNIATKIGGRQLGTTAASIARSVFGSIFR